MSAPERQAGATSPRVTIDEVRQALAAARMLTLTAWDAERHAGAYATVEHANGARWILAVRQVTIEAGPCAVARAICDAVAKSLLSDAAELVGSPARIVTRGRE